MTRLVLVLCPMVFVSACGVSDTDIGSSEQALSVFAVTTVQDTDDRRPDGVCADRDGYCSLRAAVTEANRLSKANRILLMANEEYVLMRDLEVTSDMTIEVLPIAVSPEGVPAPSGTRIRSGREETGRAPQRIFTVEGATLTLRLLEIEGVNLREIAAPTESPELEGGALWVSMGGLVLEHVDVYRGEARRGGCIFAYRSDVTLLRVDLSGCEAEWGGGIFAKRHATELTRTLAITDSALHHNSAGTRGGAIHADHNVYLDIRGTEFRSNTAATGGAMDLSVTSATLRDTDFHLNESVHHGGAIALSEGEITWEGGVAANNVAGGQGGVLFGNFTRLVGLPEGVAVSNLMIAHNSAGDRGGAIATQWSSTLTPAVDLVLDEIVAWENNAPMGGVVASRGLHVSVEDSTFDSNHAGIDGGAILLDSEVESFEMEELEPGVGPLQNIPRLPSLLTTRTSIERTNFIRNSAPHEGAALWFGGTEIGAHQTSFFGQRVGRGGSVVYGTFSDIDFLTMSCSGTTFLVPSDGRWYEFSFENGVHGTVRHATILADDGTGPWGIVVKNSTVDFPAPFFFGGRRVDVSSSVVDASDSIRGVDAGVVVDAGYNLLNDPWRVAHPTSLEGPSDMGPVGYHGGAMLCHVPQIDSLAIDGAPSAVPDYPIDSGVLDYFDIRGEHRLRGSALDRGAVERQPDDID